MPALLILKNHRFKILTLLLVSLAWYLLSPVYSFYSHRNVLPLSPFGWAPLPEDVPETQILSDERYRTAAEHVMLAMKQRRCDIGAPSFSAAVAVEGHIVWAGATGWSNIKNGIEATPDTVYRIGSTSKPVTGTALARLVQAGIMDLDTPISAYKHNLPNADWNNLTPRMLASHMAGLAHYSQEGVEKDYAGLYATVSLRNHYETMDEALSIFDGTSLRSEPGTEFYYSSQGTVLLAAVMSAAAGKPFLEVVNDEVLKPLGMKSTMPSPVHSDGEDNHATSYKSRVKDQSWQVRPWRPVNQSHRLPGGGFASTSTDLVRMGIAYNNLAYLKPETRQTFWTPQRLKNGDINPQHYGLGWRYQTWTVEGLDAIEVAAHGGVSRGAQSLLMVVPEYGMVIAINANITTDDFQDFGFLYKDIVRAFAAVQKDEFEQG